MDKVIHENASFHERAASSPPTQHRRPLLKISEALQETEGRDSPNAEVRAMAWIADPKAVDRRGSREGSGHMASG